MSEKIKKLIKQVSELCQDDKYKELSSLWERHNRGEVVEHIPITISMDPVWWAKKLGFTLKELVVDVKPETAVEFQLREKIFRYQNIPDDTVITPDISTAPTWLPTITPFGVSYLFNFENDSWYLPPLIKEKEDLNKLPFLTFEREKHEEKKEKTLKEFNEITAGEIPVHYAIPEEMAFWGPFALACNLYGYINVLEALIEDGGFVHRLMEFVTESRLKYESEKSKASGVSSKDTYSQLSEDEVDCNVISPKTYQEFIFPYQSKIAEIFKGILFHSCGNLAPVLDAVTKIPNLWKLQISPWTNLEKAAQKISGNIILQKHLLVTRDIFEATLENMEEQVTKMVSLVRNRPIEIAESGIMEGPLDKPLKWLEIARKYTKR